MALPDDKKCRLGRRQGFDWDDPLAYHVCGEPHSTFAASRKRTSPLGFAVMRFQRSLKTLDKRFSLKGLGQIASRPGSERLRTNLLIGEGREKNERHAGPLAAQVSLQLDAAHAGHLDIRNHA